MNLFGYSGSAQLFELVEALEVEVERGDRGLALDVHLLACVIDGADAMRLRSILAKLLARPGACRIGVACDGCDNDAAQCGCEKLLQHV